MWKLAFEVEAKALGISSTSGVTTGHFDYFRVVVNGAPNFGGAIFLCDKFIYLLCGCYVVVVVRL
jgi:hypothetical protein